MKKPSFAQGSLQEKLSSLKTTLHQQQRAAQEKERLAKQQIAEKNKTTHLLQDIYADVIPLKAQQRVLHSPSIEFPVRKVLNDDQELMQSMLSDLIDVETLLETDEALSFRRQGIGTDILKKLRKGEWSINAELDLHGLRSDEAREAVNEFILHAKQKNWRCVRIIHGKGWGSKNREAVLKDKVKAWLIQKNEVLTFCQAKPSDGGAGALMVLLSSKK